MNATAAGLTNRRAATRLAARIDVPGVLLAVSRDPDAKLTFIAAGPNNGERLVVKIPATEAASVAVELEGRMLVELRRMSLGALGATIPRYVRSMTVEGRPVLVSTALPGSPMSVAYHSWRHTASAATVERELTLAGGWLAELQSLTAGGPELVTWAAQVSEALRGRWDGHPGIDVALERLAVADSHLGGFQAPLTAVHGDFWFGNVLLREGQVTGVVDWELGQTAGSPLRDLARFPLAYSLYLDRHTRPGRPVPGHPRLRRTGVAPGIRYALEGAGWFPTGIRRFLADGLHRLGLPRWLWYDVALTGIGEVAATANHSGFGTGHLELLASLPAYPRRLER